MDDDMKRKFENLADKASDLFSTGSEHGVTFSLTMCVSKDGDNYSTTRTNMKREQLYSTGEGAMVVAREPQVVQIVSHVSDRGWGDFREMKLHDQLGLSRLSWNEIMTIKADAGLKSATLCEYYPADGHVVDEANIRHFWEVPMDVWWPDLSNRRRW